MATQRLERAIGVIYQPETEYWSHYFFAHLPKQFDEYIWFDIFNDPSKRFELNLK